MKTSLSLAILLALVCSAAAQVPPYVYAITLGTSSVQVLPADTLRKRVIFVNPNATALVAVCPAGPSCKDGSAIAPAINGAGCRTILPYDLFTVDGSTASGPQQFMPSAWLGIASAGSSALTILEFE